MVWVVPVPRDAALVVVGKHPSQSFDVCLPDSTPELPQLFVTSHFKLESVVSLFPAELTKLYLIFIRFHLLVVFFLDVLVDDFLELRCSQLHSFLFRELLFLVDGVNNLASPRCLELSCCHLLLLVLGDLIEGSMSLFTVRQVVTPHILGGGLWPLVFIPPNYWVRVLSCLLLGLHLETQVLVVSSLFSFFFSLAPLLVACCVSLMLQEELFFEFGQVVQQNVNVGEVEFASPFGEVATHAWQEVFVDEDESVKGAFTNTEAGQMWQEVVADEEAKEDEVVHNPLEVKGERNLDVFELQVKVLSDNRELHELELHKLLLLLLLGVVLLISTTLMRQMASPMAAPALLVLLLQECFSENVEVGLVSAKAKHDEVSISSVNAVGGVWIIAFRSTLRSDEVQDLVLTLTWDRGI